MIKIKKNATDYAPNAEQAAILPQNVELDCTKLKVQTNSEEIRQLMIRDPALLAK